MSDKSLVRLDKADFKILAELDADSRIPSARLAKKLRLSRNVVDYRIKQLQQKGVIRAFNAFIDPAKFNLVSWKIYLRFQNLSPATEKELLGHLQSHPRVWWVIRTAGAFDLMFCILDETIHDLHEDLLDFNTKFSKYVVETQLTSHIDPEFYTRGYFGKESVNASKPFLIKPIKVAIDALDLRLLSMLGQNCRLPLTELARQLKSSPRVVHYRLQRLEKEGVVTWHRLIIDPKKLGREYFKTLLVFSGVTREKEKKFAAYCQQHPEIVNTSRAAGPWDFEFECEVESYEAYNQLMQETRAAFPDLIKQYHSLLIYEQLKSENNFIEYAKE